jgi:tRNA threonylcarbamoyladenosine biosynthesis protein TsaE
MPCNACPTPDADPGQGLRLDLADEAATAALAGLIAPGIGPGFVLHLSGDLGAGKTTFTRALLRALGHTGRVRSPTFTLAEPYTLSRFDLYHFDFYRFSNPDEWRDAGFEEALDGDVAAVVEWPEKAGDSLPRPDLRVQLAPLPDPGARRAQLLAGTDRGRACLSTVARGLAVDAPAGICCSEPSAPPC